MLKTQLLFLCYQPNCHKGSTFTTTRYSLQLTQRTLTFHARRSLRTTNFVVCGCRFTNDFFCKIAARGPLIYGWLYWKMFAVNSYANCFDSGGNSIEKKRLDWEKVAYRPLFMLANTLMSCIKCTAASHPASCPRHSCNIPTACYSLKHSSNIDWCRPGFLSRGTSLLAINVSSDVALFGNSILLM